MSTSVDDMPIDPFAETVHGPPPNYADYMAVRRQPPFKGTSPANLHRNDLNYWQSRAVRTLPNTSSERLSERVRELMEKWQLYDPIEFLDHGVATVVFTDALLPRFRMELDEVRNEGLAKTQLGYYFIKAVELGYNPDLLPSGYEQFWPANPPFAVQDLYQKGKKRREEGRIWKGGRVINSELWKCTLAWPVDLPVE